ncbi:MAG: sensor histidine kinase [Bdellovibrionota bacterium]
MIFFEERKSDCVEGYFSVRNEIFEPNSDIKIEFFLAPQEEMKWGLAVFFLLQAALASLVFISQRQMFFQQHQFQFDLAAMARQVAHDIRSPLAALSMLDKEGQQITANHEKLRKDALGRLRNLVTSLLGEEQEDVNEPIGDWIGSLVEEKQIEFKDNHVTIGAVWSTDIKSVVLPGDSYMWRRVVSNLINNAVEACKGEQGSVAIEAERCAEGISLAILDNGGGIPPEVMGKLGQRGFTYGKEGGFGLGVFGAKEFVESLGGQLQIVSQTTGGTKVRMVVPPIAQTIVLIEDDVKLAELWKITAEKRGIQVRHFPSPESFLQEKASVTRDTPIYLDLSFHDTKLDPVGFGQALRQEGYAELFVCSGQDRRELAKIRWAKGICGKEPPWL